MAGNGSKMDRCDGWRISLIMSMGAWTTSRSARQRKPGRVERRETCCWDLQERYADTLPIGPDEPVSTMPKFPTQLRICRLLYGPTSCTDARLQGQGVPKAHPPQGHPVQEGQGLPRRPGKATIRPKAARLRWSAQARKSGMLGKVAASVCLTVPLFPHDRFSTRRPRL